MKYYYSLSLLVSLFVTIFLSSSLANAGSLCQDIAKADPKNVSYDFCVEEIEQGLFSENKTAQQLGELSFTLILWNIDAVFNRIHRILDEAPKLNQSTKIALNDCLDIFSGVDAEIEQGRDALKDKDFEKAKIKASATIKRFDTCGEKIKNTGDTSEWISDFTNASKNFHQMASICLGFAKLLPRVNLSDHQ